MTGGAKVLDVPANNKVCLSSNDVILIVRTGIQTTDSMDDYRRMTEVFIKQLRSRHKKVLILMDNSHVVSYGSGTVPKLAGFMKLKEFDAVAVHGLPPDYRKEVDKMIADNDQIKRIKTFDNAREAALWLAHFMVLPVPRTTKHPTQHG